MNIRPGGWPQDWPEREWADESCLPPWWLRLSLFVLCLLVVYGGARVLMWALR